MVLAVWHFSFTVSNIERSVAFYRDVLGMTLVHEQVQHNEYTAQLVGYPDAHLKVAQLKTPASTASPSTHVLELVEYVHPRGDRVDPNTYHSGSSHMAFVVDDMAAEYARLKSLGVRFKNEPVRIAAGVNLGGYGVYFWDPDQITLELIQPPPHRMEAWRNV